MKLELHLLEDFGSHLADGAAAAEYRMGRIEPYVQICDRVLIDFTGVRNANSSFMNALIAGLVEQHGKGVLNILTFKGCNPVVRVLVAGAIDLGLQKIQGKIDA
jgi:ABC-type nitrate/sulfonate/bicarbonate transport system substrate-binding protein